MTDERLTARMEYFRSIGLLPSAKGQAMTNERLIAEVFYKKHWTQTPIGEHYLSLTSEKCVRLIMEAFAEAQKKFQGLMCACEDGPCGSGICVSSPMSVALAEARKAALYEAANHLDHLFKNHGRGNDPRAGILRRLADSPAPEKSTPSTS